MPTPGTADVGMWVAIAIGICSFVLAFIVGVLTILVLYRSLSARPIAGSEYVTASEVSILKTELTQEIERAETRQKRELERVDNHVHLIATEVQTLANRIAVLPLENRKMLDAALRPINSRVELTRIQMVQIATKLNLPPVAEHIIHDESDGDGD